jgi:hypothetical protein
MNSTDFYRDSADFYVNRANFFKKISHHRISIYSTDFLNPTLTSSKLSVSPVSLSRRRALHHEANQKGRPCCLLPLLRPWNLLEIFFGGVVSGIH